jgi:hypothetical protein
VHGTLPLTRESSTLGQVRPHAARAAGRRPRQSPLAAVLVQKSLLMKGTLCTWMFREPGGARPGSSPESLPASGQCVGVPHTSGALAHYFNDVNVAELKCGRLA